jgi:N-acetylglucosaminyldiphosphoundecaprenol N-acetyl-beta-D-mannosaminyltransferase
MMLARARPVPANRWNACDGRFHVDFGRPVHALLGIPFDALDLKSATQRVAQACIRREPCFLSTPNVNFVVTAERNEAFRQSVLQSDLCIVDGMPLVWLARLMHLPIRERVAGADVFQQLGRVESPRPMRVFFFGGPDGVAQKASEVLNLSGGGLVGAGGHSPGFAPIEQLSGNERIAEINAAQPDLLLVALGAQKGQEWIMRNRSFLDVPVVTHLGAVVNFVAGTVRRAPRWMSQLGLEWGWRILEEPALWRRYASDGWALLRLGASCAVPTWRYFRHKRRIPQDPMAWRLEPVAGGSILMLDGLCAGTALDGYRDALTAAARGEGPLRVRFGPHASLDSQALGLLLLLQGYCTAVGRPFEVVSEEAELERVLRVNRIGLPRRIRRAQAPVAAG